LNRCVGIRWGLRLLALGGAAVSIASCGGSGGSSTSVQPLASAGKVVLTKTATVAASGASLTDGAGITVTANAGAMAAGSVFKLTTWSQQRPQVETPTVTSSKTATDITVAPGSFSPLGTLTITMPWSTTGDVAGTCLLAYGPSGQPLVLTRTTSFTQTAPQVTLTAGDVAFLGGTTAISSAPVEFEIVMEQIPVSTVTPADSKAMSGLQLIWRRPASRTTAATRQRIAVTVHGVLNTSDDVIDLSGFLKTGKEPAEGAPSFSTYPFDVVYAYNYNYKDTIENNGALLANTLNASWDDPTKYEVHIFGHSMGGIVSRWAVEQVGVKCCTQLVTMGSPSKGVPIEVMQNWAFGLLVIPVSLLHGLALELQPGPVELVQGSALLAKLSTSTVPSGVTFQAIGGTAFDLQTGGYLIALATYTICKDQGRLPCDGFVPLDSALGNLAVSKLAVPYNHSDLCTYITKYWPGSTAATWTPGLNREIAKLVIPSLIYKLDVDATQAITVDADDVTGDQFDPNLLFATNLGSPAQAALKWTSSDPTIVGFSNQNQLSVTLTGLKAGTATVTVQDPVTFTTTNVLVQVGPGNLLITPANQTVAPGSNTTYKVGLVTGTIPSGTQITWSIQGKGLVNGQSSVTSTSAMVTYKAPATAEQDIISVELKNPAGKVLGAQSTPINVGTPLVVSPANPTVGIGATQTLTVANSDGSTFPAGTTFNWSVSGGGKVAGSSSTTTNTPSVTYVAPGVAETETLQVQELDLSGKVINAAPATTITVSAVSPAGRAQWTYSGFEGVNTLYNGTFSAAQNYAAYSNPNGEFIFGPNTFGQNGSFSVVFASAGSATPTGDYIIQVNAVPLFEISGFGSGSAGVTGTMHIGQGTPNSDGTHTYPFNISATWVDLGETPMVSASGTFKY
jgi:hypothetical protein